MAGGRAEGVSQAAGQEEQSRRSMQTCFVHCLFVRVLLFVSLCYMYGLCYVCYRYCLFVMFVGGQYKHVHDTRPHVSIKMLQHICWLIILITGHSFLQSSFSQRAPCSFLQRGFRAKSAHHPSGGLDIGLGKAEAENEVDRGEAKVKL